MTNYSLDYMKAKIMEHGVPSYAIALDNLLTILLHRPTLDTFKFDDWVHEKYGDYESEGKNLDTMFIEIFGEDKKEIKSFFMAKMED